MADRIPHTPLYFEPNLGQFDAHVRFLAVGAKYRVWITDRELVIEMANHARARIRFGPSRGMALKAEGLDQQPGISNYFIGSDPKKWTMHVPAYSRAMLQEVYPGIDVVFYASKDTGEIEYDLIVKPGADASQIMIDFDPRLKPKQGPLGDVTLDLGGGVKLRHEVPRVHQSGRPVKYVACIEGNSLRFKIGPYDLAQSLMIDPTVVLLTYVGGVGNDSAKAIAVDSVGAIYVAGSTNFRDFPDGGFTIGSGSPYGTHSFVTKISGTLVAGVYPRAYTAYVGSGGTDGATAITVDSSGAAYVAGSTNSTLFPTVRAVQEQYGGGANDGFLFKISGSMPFQLVFSTYAGGSDADKAVGVAVDGQDSVYLGGATESLDIKTAPNAYQRESTGFKEKAFVWKFASKPTIGSGIYDLVYGTYAGGDGDANLKGMAVDQSGAVYLAGWTSLSFPKKAAAQTERKGLSRDAFVMKLSALPGSDGRNELVYSTLLGGTYQDSASGIAVDRAGNAYVVGYTASADFPIVKAARALYGQAFVTKIGAQPVGSPAIYPFVYSTLLPTRASAESSRIAVDAAGSAYVTLPDSFDLIDQAPPAASSYGKSAVLKIAGAASGSPLVYPFVYNTRMGPIPDVFDGGAQGIAVDSVGATYVVGNTRSATGLDTEVFVTKLSAAVSNVSVTALGLLDRAPANVTFTTTGAGCDTGLHQTPKSFQWAPGTSCLIAMNRVVLTDKEGSEYHFETWSDTSSANPSRLVQAGIEPQLVNASYDLYHHIVTGVNEPDRGSVSPLVDTYIRDNTDFNLTALPNPGYGLVGWGGSGGAIGVILKFQVFSAVRLISFFERIQISTTALQFVPITPCRSLDTRDVIYLDSHFSRSTKFTGTCGIPDDAVALSLNVTLLPFGPLGYFTMDPTGQPQTLNSVLNSLDGRIKANAAIVRLGTDGKINLATTDSTHVVVDVNGYFIPPAANTLAFYPVPPCRVLDTRRPAGLLGGPSLAAQTSRSIAVQSSNCNIPPTAKAYSLNATVVPAGPLGYLTLWPTGVARPVVSTLNNLTGTVVANAAIVPTGTNGSIDAYVTDRTELVLDIMGYFAPPGQTGALNFYVLPPCRALDTRNANGPLGGPILEAAAEREFNIASSACGIAGNAKAYSMNATLVPPSTFGYLSMWPSGSAQPLVSTLNAVDGAITSNAAIVPAGVNGAIKVFTSNRAHLIFDINGYFLP